jgi:glycosyltransferase involved in cell wall biosynthesis
MEKLMNPVLSIVVPSYNSELYIRECLESLRAAKSDRVEYILIDGGSSDNTMSIVEEYRDLFTVVISEKDKGQSDAFNKGFVLAKGEYLTWLNSDDVFAPGALDYVLSWIEKDRKPWYAANVVYIDSESKIIKCCQSGGFEKWALRFGVLNVFGAEHNL